MPVIDDGMGQAAGHGPAKTEKSTAPTEYMVLKLTRHEPEPTIELWEPVVYPEASEDAGVLAVFRTRGKKRAIDEAVEIAGEGSFRAIPLSSWKGGETRVQVTKMASSPIDGRETI